MYICPEIQKFELPEIGIASIDSSKFSSLKGGNIDGCGRGVRTSIGTLASTKAPFHAGEKGTARSVTSDSISRQYFLSGNFNTIRKPYNWIERMSLRYYEMYILIISSIFELCKQ